MHATLRLFQPYAGRIMLFTRQNCSLCENAKKVLNEVRQSRYFEFNQIEVMAKGQEQWKNIYEFDVPVIHIQRQSDPKDMKDIQPAMMRKLMHRFTEGEVEKAMDELELE